jgi:hypothetical protein
MLLLLFLLAQTRMPLDDSPTAFACNMDVALQGKICTYEGTPGAASAADNMQLAAESAQRACGEVRAQLRAQCASDTAAAARTAACTLEGKARLADERGLLSPEARGCVDALRAALSKHLIVDDPFSPTRNNP